MERTKIIKELLRIPGVGKSISEDFYNLGIRKIDDLKDKSPETLYSQLCTLVGAKVDRCMLYVMRCAVYFASNKIHDKEKLKWWNWKD